MANTMTVTSVSEMMFWKDFMESDDSIKNYSITNRSDYSGVEYEIGWNYAS